MLQSGIIAFGGLINTLIHLALYNKHRVILNLCRKAELPDKFIKKNLGLIELKGRLKSYQETEPKNLLNFRLGKRLSYLTWTP